MSVLYVMIPVALGLATAALVAFFWAVRDGQYDDVDAARYRLLLDDDDPYDRQGTGGSDEEMSPESREIG